MRSPAVGAPSARPHLLRLVGITLLAVVSQPGCGREFYREWANQDVSEAVYEKSRDPRFRMDLFSVEPPGMSRFADPYDPERPPAPPDDFATQAMAPVPQWPDHRLITPVEGTGYLALLEKDAERYEPPPPRPATLPLSGTDLPGPPPGSTSPFIPAPGSIVPPPGPSSITAPTAPGDPLRTPRTPNDPNPTDADLSIPTRPPIIPPGPGASRANSGTNAVAMSPIPMSPRPSSPAASAAPKPAAAAAPSRVSAPGSAKDAGVRRVAMQDMPQPMPIPTGPTTPEADQTAPGDPLRTPRTPNDPNPTDPNLSSPLDVRPDQTNPEIADNETAISTLSGLFVPENVPLDEAIAGGLPSNSRPSILTMEKAFELALVNSRTYQTQLENLYISALPVTLQRFAFQPQFIAGLSPVNSFLSPSSGGANLGPSVSPVNSFLYSTRETGAQQSTLNLGTVAGIGKSFDAGGRILASFASSVVFNFVGRNPSQPTVRSFLPIQFVQPFLRGGGRAVTLEALTQAERTLVYAVRNFARYRQEFVVNTLVGGGQNTFGPIGTSGQIDPTANGFLNLVRDLQVVENNVKNVSVFERIIGVYRELVKGESSGLTQLQVDQIDQSLQTARSNLFQAQVQYRNDIDTYKLVLGMPPDVPLVVSRQRTEGFRKVFNEIDEWSLSPKRELPQLDLIVSRLPSLETPVLEGRAFVTVFNEIEDQTLEDLLLTAERVALENRLDLMNARASLYDSWRQIRVTANALKGVLNVAVTNQFVTPPTTNNPFAFVDQAKNFSLVLNAELPLVRIAERNAFRQSLITYQRARRTLQASEDSLKNLIRANVRQMELIYRQYNIAKRNLVLSVRQKDQSFEQIIAPTAGTTASTQGATQTINLVNAQQSVLNQENNLVSLWYQYQVQRLSLYRDLGILPYDEWEAFDELFPADRASGTDAAPAGGRPAVVQPGEAAAPPVGGP
ncbi:hypothetical protein TA3x_002445 [Tundrisphaera sp. TA3]|uniref:TolC family protein n=1 Tax=Tundrisphaera sp. TA3 TaxID=3435775 RepID=UPI003EB85C3C